MAFSMPEVSSVMGLTLVSTCLFIEQLDMDLDLQSLHFICFTIVKESLRLRTMQFVQASAI